ncbi:MAG: hypothetical protein AAB317_02930 [Nitrospirota bacterium]
MNRQSIDRFLKAFSLLTFLITAIPAPGFTASESGIVAPPQTPVELEIPIAMPSVDETTPQNVLLSKNDPKLKIYIYKIVGDKPESDIQKNIISSLKKDLESDPFWANALDINEPSVALTDINSELQSDPLKEGSLLVWGDVISSPQEGEQVHLNIAFVRRSLYQPYLIAMPSGIKNTDPVFPTLPNQITILLPGQPVQELNSLAHFVKAWGLFEKHRWVESSLQFDHLIKEKFLPSSGMGGIFYYMAFAQYQVYLETETAAALERAIHLFNKAMEAARGERNWVEYARTQVSLGIAHRMSAFFIELPQDRLRSAVGLFQESARLLKDQKNDGDYAFTQNLLGVTYYNLATLGLEPEQNLMFAIKALSNVLGLFQSQEKPHPESLSIVQNNLGLTYQTLAFWGIEPEKNLKSAAERLKQSVISSKESGNGLITANALNNLGLSYQSLALWGVEPVISLNASNEVLREAISLWEEQKNNTRYAISYGSMGANYQSLASWGVEPGNNLKHSVEILLEAVQLLKEQKQRSEYPTIQANLGVSYQMLAVRGIDAETNFMRSIHALQDAAAIWKEQKNRAGFTNAKNNIGVDFQGLVRLGVDPEKNQALADESFKEARMKEPKATIPQ